MREVPTIRWTGERDRESASITHDLAVVRQVVDRISVMFEGEIVESGPADEILSHPTHTHTRKLMEWVPGTAGRAGER